MPTYGKRPARGFSIPSHADLTRASHNGQIHHTSIRVATIPPRRPSQRLQFWCQAETYRSPATLASNNPDLMNFKFPPQWRVSISVAGTYPSICRRCGATADKRCGVTSRAIVTLVCLLLLPANLHGQRYSFKRYDQSSGLPNVSVQTLLQDRTGFLWIGTDNGLYRYDGRRYRTFSAADGLPGAHVVALHQTNDGTIWASTTTGLGRFRGDRFEAVDVSRDTLLETWPRTAGWLYAGTSTGLVVSIKAAGDTQSPSSACIPILETGLERPEVSPCPNPASSGMVAAGKSVASMANWWKPVPNGVYPMTIGKPS